jgi:hypothetical protein
MVGCEMRVAGLNNMENRFRSGSIGCKEEYLILGVIYFVKVQKLKYK